MTMLIAVANAIQYIKTQSSKKTKGEIPFTQKPMQGKAASDREDTVYRV